MAGAFSFDSAKPVVYTAGMSVIKSIPFASRLRKFREAANLTQTELAAKLKCTPQAIWNLENGRNSLSVELAAALADALGVSIDRLIRD